MLAAHKQAREAIAVQRLAAEAAAHELADAFNPQGKTVRIYGCLNCALSSLLCCPAHVHVLLARRCKSQCMLRACAAAAVLDSLKRTAGELMELKRQHVADTAASRDAVRRVAAWWAGAGGAGGGTLPSELAADALRHGRMKHLPMHGLAAAGAGAAPSPAAAAAAARLRYWQVGAGGAGGGAFGVSHTALLSNAAQQHAGAPGAGEQQALQKSFTTLLLGRARRSSGTSGAHISGVAAEGSGAFSRRASESGGAGGGAGSPMTAAATHHQQQQRQQQQQGAQSAEALLRASDSGGAAALAGLRGSISLSAPSAVVAAALAAAAAEQAAAADASLQQQHPYPPSSAASPGGVWAALSTGEGPLSRGQCQLVKPLGSGELPLAPARSLECVQEDEREGRGAEGWREEGQGEDLGW